MNPKKYDIIVIGAGYAGLTAAALLQKKGHSVALLEAHTEIGGCASFYDRDGFRFEAGATTISGIKPHQPFGKLFDELSINPELIKMDPGVVVHLAGDTFNRPADPVDLLQASEAFFGKTTIPFWQKILKLEETAYQLSGSNSYLPPYSLGDYLKQIRFRNLSGLPLLPALFTSTETVLQRMGLAENTLFRQFVEEQLMITAQNTSSDTPFLTAALALAYPNDTYYPVGGMTAPAQLISDVFQRYGGTLLLKEQVTAIIREANSRYLIRSKRGNNYSARAIVSAIPVYNLPALTEGEISSYFARVSSSLPPLWGAATVNFGISDAGLPNTLYHQFHGDAPHPGDGSRSVFISLSHPNDTRRAPSGWRSVAISTHTKPSGWFGLPKEEYIRKKSVMINRMMEYFFSAFPEARGNEVVYLEGGTPKTFSNYTRRKDGAVGGIPHSIRFGLLRMPKTVTPFPNFYCVGDSTAFGQGTLAVVLSTMNLAERFHLH